MIMLGNEPAEFGGKPGITFEEGRTQFGMWAMFAAPLIMGNDLRNVTARAKAVLLNHEIIAVDQDPLGKMGLRVSDPISLDTQVWARELANGDVAVALLNAGGGGGPLPPGKDTCEWKSYPGGYNESSGGAAGNQGCYTATSTEEAKAACCSLGKLCVRSAFGAMHVATWIPPLPLRPGK